MLNTELRRGCRVARGLIHRPCLILESRLCGGVKVTAEGHFQPLSLGGCDCFGELVTTCLLVPSSDANSQ